MWDDNTGCDCPVSGHSDNSLNECNLMDIDIELEYGFHVWWGHRITRWPRNNRQRQYNWYLGHDLWF